MLKKTYFYPLAFALLFCLSCAATPTPKAQNEYTFTSYVSGIEVPWGMEWLSSGELLVTDRSGILYVVQDGEIFISLKAGYQSDTIITKHDRQT